MYVFDTSSLICLSNYYQDRFPTLCRHVNDYVAQGKIVSVREVRRELANTSDRGPFDKWVLDNKNLFKIPERQETEFVAEIFRTKNFQDLVRKKELLAGRPVADPFVIAAARAYGGWVVPEESLKNNAARIPTVCQHFKIPFTNLQGFMERENWIF